MVHAKNRFPLTRLWCLWRIADEKITDIKTYAQGLHAHIRPVGTRILYALRKTRHPKKLFHILRILNQKGLIGNPLILRACDSIANHYQGRLRDIESFSVNTRNSRHQYSMLLRHLFATYSVPEFMDSVWFNGGNRYQQWFKHLGSGGNLRTAPGLPIQVTKKIAHHFCQSPAHYSVGEALRAAQIYAIGGDKRLVEAIRGTRLVQTFTDDAFWVSLLRFLSANISELDQRHINLIVEYIWDLRFVPCKVLIAGGGERTVSPPQPRFRLNGKCLKTLLADAETWQNAPPDDRVVGLEWQPSEKIKSFRFPDTRQPGNDTRFWSITELLSSSALVEEGKALGHCVGGSEYAEACYGGDTTIWSLGCDSGTGIEKLLTIEVANEKIIVEIRGEKNRLPTQRELTIIYIWALTQGLDIDT